MGTIKIWVKGMLRRKRQLARVCVTAFLVILFITGIILFQENMNQWQMAVNKERFGDWFITESRRQPTEELLKHPYLEEPAESTYLYKVRDGKWQELNFFFGHVTDEFIKQGRIDVDEGRLPEKEGEIALEWNALASLGYVANVGDKITIRYYDGPEYLDTSKVEKEYTLTGILSNYTSVWNVGVGVPAAIISDAEYELIENKEDLYHTYIYPLDLSVITDDYSLVYENVEDLAGRSIVGYNAYVYDFQPWGSAFVYNYMYVIVMVIGITAFVYQIIVYQRARKASYARHVQLGAGRGRVMRMAFAELAVLVVVFGIAGMMSAVWLGKVICGLIETDMNVEFYYVAGSVYLKAGLSLLMSVVIGLIASAAVFAERGRKPKKKIVREFIPRTYINCRNIVSQTQMRLSRTSGRFQAVCVRIFALCITAVLVVCIYNVWQAYGRYNDNSDLLDIVGVKETGQFYPYKFIYFAESDQSIERYGNRLPYYDKILDIDYEEYKARYQEAQAERDELSFGMGDFTLFKYRGKYTRLELGSNYGGALMSSGKVNLTHGLSKELIEQIEDVPGVSELKYSAFESDREWMWEGKNIWDTGFEAAYQSYSLMREPRDVDRPYLFATQYMDIDRAMYDRLSKYMDPEVADYDEFVKGNQVLLILDKTLNNEYDKTISVGEKLGYTYYDFDHIRNSRENNVYSYVSEFNKLVRAKYQKLLEFVYSITNLPTLEEKQEAIEKQKKMFAEYESAYNALIYDAYVEVCEEPVVAGIVYLDDAVRKELEDYIVKYGYYTAIASHNLGERLMDGQKELMEDFLGEELPDNVDTSMKYNQVSIKYDMSSVYSATDNVIKAYFEQNDVSYVSNANVKADTRSAAVNAILFYGITAIGAVVVYIFVSVIIVGNRIENRRTRFTTLIRLGSDKDKVVKMCMRESAREAMWCVLLLPIQLVVHLIMYKHAVGNIN